MDNVHKNVRNQMQLSVKVIQQIRQFSISTTREPEAKQLTFKWSPAADWSILEHKKLRIEHKQ